MRDCGAIFVSVVKKLIYKKGSVDSHLKLGCTFNLFGGFKDQYFMKIIDARQSIIEVFPSMESEHVWIISV